jgi:dTMP kinase
METRKGLFVVLEGPDGVGKSTVMQRVAGDLGMAHYREGMRFRLTAEPTRGTPFGTPLRAALTGQSPQGPLTMLYGMMADRAWHLEQQILPWVAEGHLVICDRYHLSTMVYQGVAEEADQWVLMSTWAAFPRPDLTLVLWAPPATLRERLSTSGKAPEKYEGAILDKVAARYEQIASMCPGYDGTMLAQEGMLMSGMGTLPNHVAINATRPLDEVVAKCAEVIAARWEAR